MVRTGVFGVFLWSFYGVSVGNIGVFSVLFRWVIGVIFDGFNYLPLSCKSVLYIFCCVACIYCSCIILSDDDIKNITI